MIGYYSDSNHYSYLWNKYRPAILKLMVDTMDSPQQYKFSNHEFRVAHPTEKGGYSFTLRVFKNRAVNDIKKSGVAKGLLKMLQQSGTATQLTDKSIFQFVMDRGFLLNIHRENAIQIAEQDKNNALKSPYKPVSGIEEAFNKFLDHPVESE